MLVIVNDLLLGVLFKNTKNPLQNYTPSDKKFSLPSKKNRFDTTGRINREIIEKLI